MQLFMKRTTTGLFPKSNTTYQALVQVISGNKNPEQLENFFRLSMVS